MCVCADRLSGSQYTDVLTGGTKVPVCETRNVAGHSTVKSGDGQLKAGQTVVMVQLGGDIAQ